MALGDDFFLSSDLACKYGVACSFLDDNFASLMLQTDNRREARDFLADVKKNNKYAKVSHKGTRVTLKPFNIVYYMISKDRLR